MSKECGGNLVAVGVVGITGVPRAASSSTGIEAWKRAHDEGESAGCVTTGKGGKGET